MAGPIWALGTMSGTSLDGVDAALLRTDGESIFEFGASAYRPYSASERAVLHSALGCWPDDPRTGPAAEVVERAHLAALGGIAGAELVGFHGQTLAHDPARGRTHQAGDGASLARALGLPVVWDFRSADVAAGGQGAPLAPFFHFACAKWIGATAPLAFLNLGGVGNLTWIDPAAATPDTPGALLAFDTGPANAPIDDLMTLRLGLDHDEGGALASLGRFDPTALSTFLSHPYFAQRPPKSLDRDTFKGLAASVQALSDADAAATLTAIAAASVAAGMADLPQRPSRVLVTGGGRHNASLMALLECDLGCPVAPVESVSLDGDMLEAQAFAYLAVRVLRGLPTSAPGTTGTPAPVSGGQISRP